MMRSVLMLSAVLWLLGMVWAAETAISSDQHGDLTVVVLGLKNTKGAIRIAVANSEQNYDEEDEGKAFRGAVAAIDNDKAVWVFKELPFGEYAVKCYHDKNENSTLDTNFVGIPTEPYGFSNNARGTLGPAAYTDAKFTLDSPTKTVEVTVE